MRFAVLGSEAERRDGLKALLRQINRHARFCEARDWVQACRALRRMPVELLVVDWHDEMRVSDVRALVAEQRALRLAVFVDDASPCRVRQLMDEGVHGVIPRSTNPKLISRLLELVLAGGYYAPHGALLRDGAAASRVTPPPAPVLCELPPPSARRSRFAPTLSPRQEQIMRCVHMGSTNKMIARTLGISEGTVKIHLASIFQQLGAPNRAAAVAIYNGWLTQHLEVLRTEDERSPKPVIGEAGPVPLRRGGSYTYPLPGEEEPNDLPMAAEPDAPFHQTIPDTGSR
ncbi:MAG TPA: response regulator transcription factor [Trinickia sp.]|jgi:DNA-binding NarL/FixJ family response regulator|uniref:helix-turn-helix transcriptional regulator n=1 Tax=Trinickia sp. TaxID=2571163 RepID=UPI002CE5940E|nr:response regulator transcription factor [Trinickia sp.]HTI16126.1 response regulator transcription factor [Trinickia sp.]